MRQSRRRRLPPASAFSDGPGSTMPAAFSWVIEATQSEVARDSRCSLLRLACLRVKDGHVHLHIDVLGSLFLKRRVQPDAYFDNPSVHVLARINGKRSVLHDHVADADHLPTKLARRSTREAELNFRLDARVVSEPLANCLHVGLVNLCDRDHGA